RPAAAGGRPPARLSRDGRDLRDRDDRRRHREPRRGRPLHEARSAHRSRGRRQRRMSAIAVPRARDSLPRPVEAGLEFLRLLAGRPSGLIGFFGIVFFLLLAYVVPIFVPAQEQSSVNEIYQTPSLQHLLGTDNSGRDVLNLIVQGGKEILSVAILTAGITTLIAMTLGSLAATLGGKVDATLVGIADIVLTVPGLI